MAQDAKHEQHDIYDLGLQADLAMWTRKPIERRRILKMGILGIGVLLAGCGANAVTPTSTTLAATSTATATAIKASASASAAASSSAAASPTASAAAATDIEEIPQETAGPYP